MSHAVLVGPDTQENLPLRYLASAAERAGHRVELVALDDRAEVGAVARRVLALGPDLVGLGMAFQHSIDDFLTLAAELRARGYRGHLTCGGHVPTFCFAELLADAPALDTAVRHEGEETLTEMLDRLDRGEPLTAIDGTVWRRGGRLVVAPRRPPLRDLDALSPPRRRAEPYVVGGVPIGFLIAARGCVGECSYCSIRAFATDDGGVPYRMRAPARVADEIATLRRELGVRVIFVQDDLFILPSERTTLQRIRALDQALRERGVDDVILWVKGRPETVTPAVAEAARRLGAIHLFLGVESASLARLRYLGRRHRPEDNQRAVARCRAAGITPSFNLMLFDPDCSLADVAASLELAADHVELPWNFCRTEIYAGTPLHARLSAQGRLLGSYRGWGYRMADQRAELMFRLVRVCLHERALAFDSLLNKLISLSFARQVHDHLFPGATSEAFGAQVERLVVEVHRDTVAVLRGLLDYASRAPLDDRDGVRAHAVELALAVGRRDIGWRQQAERLWTQLNVRGALLTRRARLRADGIATALAAGSGRRGAPSPL